MFLFDKIRFLEISFFFFFFFYWRVKVLKFTHIIYVMKNWSDKNKAKIAPESI